MEKDSLISSFTAIGDLSENGLFIYNLKENSFDYANNSLMDQWNLSHQADPFEFLECILEEDKKYLQTQYESLKSEKRIENLEFSIKPAEQEKKVLSGSFYLIEDDSFVVGIIRDVTEEKEHSNYIINYGAKKNTLLDMVTHNLSGPLLLLKNIIHSIENALQKSDLQSIETYLRLSKHNISDSINIVNDFLKEEHLVSEHIYVKKDRFDLIEKINTVLEQFRKSYPDYQFNFQTTFETLYITNDDVKFMQIINNMLSNAVKFSDNNKNVEILLEDETNFVTLSVLDYGIGIPDNMKPLVFQRNTAASRPGVRGEQSIGMGLYICKKLIHLLGGEITFESEENTGSVFTIQLPKQLHNYRP
jgi:two-component system, OmpR family, sensor histidine kinase VicK